MIALIMSSPGTTYNPSTGGGKLPHQRWSFDGHALISEGADGLCLQWLNGADVDMMPCAWLWHSGTLVHRTIPLSLSDPRGDDLFRTDKSTISDVYFRCLDDGSWRHLFVINNLIDWPEAKFRIETKGKSRVWIQTHQKKDKWWCKVVELITVW